MKLGDRIREVSSLECNGFGPPVLFHFLLQDEEKKKSMAMTDYVTTLQRGNVPPLMYNTEEDHTDSIP